jgi:protein ImuB
VLYACIFIPNFAIQALLSAKPELRKEAVAVIYGEPPLAKVIAVNTNASKAGIAIGDTKAQAEIAGAIVMSRSDDIEAAAHRTILNVAATFSPRVHDKRPDTVLLDAAGLHSLFGTPAQIVKKIRIACREKHFSVNVAIAENPDTAIIAAKGIRGGIVINSSTQIAPLPMSILEPALDVAETLELWGISTLGQFAKLPTRQLSERLGQEGVMLQKLTRGEQVSPFIAGEAAHEFKEQAELDYPVEFLDSLSFVLASLLERLCADLNKHFLATNEIRLQFDLETSNISEAEQRCHKCVIKLPSPTADSKLLLHLLQLNLDSNPPAGPVIKVGLIATPVSPRHQQQGLFAPSAPDPDKTELTLARIASFVGDGEVGSPNILDTHRPRGFVIRKFVPPEQSKRTRIQGCSLRKQAMRLYETPKYASIRFRSDVPIVFLY